MKIEQDIKLNFDDVLIKPKPSELSSRSQVNLEVSYITKNSKKRISGFPLIVSNMTTTGTIKMAEALHKHKTFVSLNKFIITDDLINFFNKEESLYSFYTLGMLDEIEKLKFINDNSKYLNKICLDAANGYMYSFLDRIKLIRDLFPNHIIMAGNVATPEGVENLIKAGADIAKCGIANGSYCITKNKTGIGYSQFSVAVECGQAANELNALCCSDGGCKSSADVAKALAAGSHFVMTGTLVGGTDECDSEWMFDENNKKIKMFMYGMSSKYANDKFAGGMKEYRAAEGKEDWMDYKGNVNDLIVDIKGGLASCCTYTNTKNLENLHKNSTFTIVK